MTFKDVNVWRMNVSAQSATAHKAIRDSLVKSYVKFWRVDAKRSAALPKQVKALANSVIEVTHCRKDHCKACFISSGNHFIIAD